MPLHSNPHQSPKLMPLTQAHTHCSNSHSPLKLTPIIEIHALTQTHTHCSNSHSSLKLTPINEIHAHWSHMISLEVMPEICVHFLNLSITLKFMVTAQTYASHTKFMPMLKLISLTQTKLSELTNSFTLTSEGESERIRR